MKTLLIAFLCIAAIVVNAQTNYSGAEVLSLSLSAGSIQATSNAVVGGLVVNTNATVGGTLNVTGTITGPGSGITSLAAANLTGTVSVNRFNGGTSASSLTFLRGDGTWVTPSSSGVTSVGLTLPAWLTVANSPITSFGTLAVTANGTTVTHDSLAITNATATKTLVVSNTVTSYNGEATMGNGIGSIVGSVALTGQTAAIGSTTMYTAPSGGGLYELTFYCECTTVSGAGTPTLNVTIGWIDDNATQSVVFTSAFPLSTKGYSTGTIVSNGAPKCMRVASGGTITYTTTIGTAAGTPQYALYMTLKRVQ